MHIDGAYSCPCGSRVREVKRTGQEYAFKAQDSRKDAESRLPPAGAAEGRAGPAPVSQDMLKQIFNLLQASGAGENKDGRTAVTKETLEALKLSDQASGDVKAAADKLAAFLKAAAGRFFEKERSGGEKNKQNADQSTAAQNAA